MGRRTCIRRPTDISDRGDHTTDFGHVAEHNLGSARMLARAGFVKISSKTSHSDFLCRDVVEHIYRLTR